ncbi:unnamed protein product [Amoebophrya sp. A25]|nr:unnamed protein product [Amoebophrya sp. A25]|eukprot:GSA25T00005120001.1
MVSAADESMLRATAPTSSMMLLDLLLLCADFSVLIGGLSLVCQIRQTRSLAGLSVQTVGALLASRGVHFAAGVLGFHYDPFRSLLVDTAIVFALAVLAMQVMEFQATYEGLGKDKFGRWMLQLLDTKKVGGGFAMSALGSSGGLAGPTGDYASDLPPGVPAVTVAVLQGSCLYLASFILAVVWTLVRRTSMGFGSLLYCWYETLTLLALFPQVYMFASMRADQRGTSTPRDALLRIDFLLFFAVNKVALLGFWLLYPILLGGSASTLGAVQPPADTPGLAAAGAAAAAAEGNATSGDSSNFYLSNSGDLLYPANRGVQMAAECLNLLMLSDYLYARAKVTDSIQAFASRNLFLGLYRRSVHNSASGELEDPGPNALNVGHNKSSEFDSSV